MKNLSAPLAKFGQSVSANNSWLTIDIDNNPPEKCPRRFFEHPPPAAVKVIGLVCAKSRQAGQFSCFL
ncbi:MAG: hypothetical protein WCI38_10635, partial [Chthoniobacterales bacterium]